MYDVRVKPGFLTTVGEVRLKEQAKRYVERIRFNTLPKTVPQIDQSGGDFHQFHNAIEPVKFSCVLSDYPNDIDRFSKTFKMIVDNFL